MWRNAGVVGATKSRCRTEVASLSHGKERSMATRNPQTLYPRGGQCSFILRLTAGLQKPDFILATMKVRQIYLTCIVSNQ